MKLIEVYRSLEPLVFRVVDLRNHVYLSKFVSAGARLPAWALLSFSLNVSDLLRSLKTLILPR